MSTIVTRTVKGSPLTHTELDANFNNLNTDKAGYVTGEGGAVTQLTSRTTGVTLNKKCGQITLFSTTTTAGLVNVFTVTNSTIAATDTIAVSHASGGTAGQYIIYIAAVAAGSFQVAVYTPVAQAAAAAPILNFAVIKSVAA
jgi:hypothetical protein